VKRWLLVLILCGCGVSDDRFSVAEKDAIKSGMSKDEVEKLLGKPTTTILSMGDQEAVQWTRGSDENVSSIAVNYSGGKVAQVNGSNLK
jgi:hypothetical protein